MRAMVSTGVVLGLAAPIPDIDEALPRWEWLRPIAAPGPNGIPVQFIGPTTILLTLTRYEQPLREVQHSDARIFRHSS
jgi:hypothetical protein